MILARTVARLPTAETPWLLNANRVQQHNSALWDKTRSFWDIKNSLSHKQGSEQIERANEWAQRRARAKRAVRSKQTSERCERTSERTNEWPSTHIWVLRGSGPQRVSKTCPPSKCTQCPPTTENAPYAPLSIRKFSQVVLFISFQFFFVQEVSCDGWWPRGNWKLKVLGIFITLVLNCAGKEMLLRNPVKLCRAHSI